MICQVPLEDLERVPVKYLQQAFKASGIDSAEGANNMGWFHSKNGQPDASRFLRTIGLRPMREPKEGPAIFRKKVDYDMAIDLCQAMHYDPVDMGL